MRVVIALLYLLAVVLIALAGLGVVPGRAAVLGAGSALLAFALPAIAAGLGGS